MKKLNITTTLRPAYKKYLIALSEELGLSLGQTIEYLLDRKSDDSNR